MTDTLTLTDEHAHNVGVNLSNRIKTGYRVVTYLDAKNGRLVINIYPNTTDSTKKIAGQIKMFKARVFERGQQLDDSMFTGA